jgi:hypothetical protein
VSVEYYARWEGGNANGVSDSILEALVRVLQLDDTERAHLYDLTRGMTTAARTRRRPARPGVRPGAQQLLRATADVPAFVQNGRLDVPAANPLARALYADLFDDAGPGSAAARRTTPLRVPWRGPPLPPDWNRVADDIVSQFTTGSGMPETDEEADAVAALPAAGLAGARWIGRPPSACENSASRSSARLVRATVSTPCSNRSSGWSPA